MIELIEIQNFKSITNLSFELGRINVFIGANGSGKSNILEAIGAAASEKACRIEVKDMISKGIRIAKPDLMFSSFRRQRMNDKIKLWIKLSSGKALTYNITNQTPSDIYSVWACSLHAMGSEMISNDTISDIESYVSQYLIYSLSLNALRGLSNESYQYPLGIYGEGLDVLLNNLPQNEIEQIKQTAKECIAWIDDIFFDNEEIYKMQGYKLGRSKSNLYFRDKYMQKKNNLFSAENANEGALELLFYLTLFVSKKTPAFFAIDNIETGLNPRLCRFLIKSITELSSKNEKQALITTHNPAVLDGLNLHDDKQRLFVVSRNDEGNTTLKRIKLKPETNDTGKTTMLSELWIKGFLGGLPDNF